MQKISIIISLLALVGCLSALRVIHYDGSSWDIDLPELQNSGLVCFETVRDKDGKQLRENWEGISLLPWLEKYARDNWHSLRVETNDGYVLKLSRLELSANNAYLALKHEGETLSDYDVRIIIPSYRENKWPRNLKSILIEDFKPMFPPRQIFAWDNWFASLKSIGYDASSTIGVEMLMRNGFVQESADVLIVDKQMQSIRLRYPDDLTDSKLVMGLDNSLRLVANTSKKESNIYLGGLGEIIYLQCGPIAYIRKAAIKDIREIGTSLAWDWKNIELKEYKRQGTRFKGGAIKAGSWLGLE